MSDFREVTEAELALVQSCGPDERCIMYGDEFIKLPLATVGSLYESAFKEAYAAALKLAGGLSEGQQAEIEDMDLGQTYMRVTITNADGKQFSGVGAIPDPRPH